MVHNFASGEASPSFEGRADHARYANSLRTCLNYVVQPKGGVVRRAGSVYLAAVKDPASAVRLAKFEFSITQAYLLELGPSYIRFYKNGARLENPPGTPVEVATPYAAGDLFAVQMVQSADVMWLVHPSHAPRQLLRYSDTSWKVREVVFNPPPSAEEDTNLNVALTIAGTTVTAASALWLDSDVGRQLIITDPSLASDGRGVIQSLSSAAPATACTITILGGSFPASLAAGAWKLTGSPQAAIRLYKDSTLKEPITGPRGTVGALALTLRDIVATELVSNGNFASGLSGWTNYSGAALVSGTCTAGGSATVLEDTSKNLLGQGVRVGMYASNLTDGVGVKVTGLGTGTSSVVTETLPGGHTWGAGDSYAIYNTGAAVAVDNTAQLVGGPAGVGWIEQALTTTAGRRYRATFDVSEGPIACQVGSAAKAVDLFAEASFPIKAQQEVFFTASGATSYLQFRNNQPTPARVDNVSCKAVSAATWRSADVGKYVKLNNGVVQLTSVTDAYQAQGRVLAELSTDAEAAAGAWTLEVAAWSASRGYPRTVSFYQQRLAYAGTAMQPQTVWLSATGAFDDFATGTLDDSALEFELTSNEMNVIQWMEPFRDLFLGTPNGEAFLRGVNGPLTPKNAEQVPLTNYGSDTLRPLRAQNSLLLVQRGGRQLQQLVFDETGSFVQGRDLTLFADHITESGLVQVDFQRKPLAVVWGVRTDGTLIGLTYDVFEQLQGWHRHTTNGVIESVCVLPKATPTDQETEEVYVAVKRTIGTATRRWIERLTPGVYVDAAVVYSGAATTTLTGLSHLNGATVQIVGAGAVYPEQVVSGGQVTLSRAVTSAQVGLGYTSQLVTMRPEVALREGTLQGRRKRWVKLTARLLDSVGLRLNGQDVPFRRMTDAMDTGVPARDQEVSLVNLGWDTDGAVTVEQVLPRPSTVLALIGQLEVESL
jgi:hypothetical protein